MTTNTSSLEMYHCESTDLHLYNTTKQRLGDTKIRRLLKEIWKRKRLNPEGAFQSMSNVLDDFFPKMPPDARFCFDPEFQRIVAFIPSRSKYSVAWIDAGLFPAIVYDAEFVADSKSAAPPALAKFLLLLIPKKHREHLLGDLEEEYKLTVLPEYGLFKAKLWYWWQIAMSIAPLIIGHIRRILVAAVMLSRLSH